MLYILILLSKLVMWPYLLVVWPIAYATRKTVRKWHYGGRGWQKALAFPLWITMNDRYMDYGESWFIHQFKPKSKFLLAWVWSWARNNSDNWNYFVVRRPHAAEIVIKSWTTDNRNPLLHRRLKWEYWDEGKQEWIGDWTTNKGDRLNQERTWLGSAFCTYRTLPLITIYNDEGEILRYEYGRKYYKEWRYSHAGIWWNKIMVNIKLGYNENGEILADFKIRKFDPKYTRHWK